MVLGEGDSTGTVDETKDLISNEEENDFQDENEGEFHLLFINSISLKSMNTRILKTAF